MKKLIITVLVLLVLYVLAGVMAWRFLPQKIADAEGRLYGVRVAIGQLSNDQFVLSDRMRAITASTLGAGKTKVDEVAAMLGDPDLNHLALVYLGSDWSLQHSSFLGAVKHMRTLLSMQKNEREASESYVVSRKIEELEAREKHLSRRLRSPSEETRFAIELRDVREQLNQLRYSPAHNKEWLKDPQRNKDIEAKAKNEDAIFKLANDYQNSTVGTLNKVLAGKLSELKIEANEPNRLRRAMSIFNVWPLNVIFKIPEGEVHAQ